MNDSCRKGKHNWTWKTADHGYWVVCDMCAKSDKHFKTEREANNRIRELKGMWVPNGTTNMTLALPVYSMNRRMREARRAARARAR